MATRRNFSRRRARRRSAKCFAGPCGRPGSIRGSRWAAAKDLMGQNRPHAADARRVLSAFVLHRLVREPFELDHKWMPHLTLRHYQACGIPFKRNPPLGACTSAPKELASRVLMVERRRLQDQRSREPVPPASKFSKSRKAYPHTLR